MAEEPDGPSAPASAFVQDRELFDENGKTIIGKRGFRRVDGLRYLLDRGGIEEHQYLAGRRLQDDMQLSQVSNCPASGTGKAVHGGSYDLPSQRLDAAKRASTAFLELPSEIRGMVRVFLEPDDDARTIEQIAAKCGEHKRVVSFGIKAGLTLLSRHYGYST